jgi:hypothetical protein
MLFRACSCVRRRRYSRVLKMQRPPPFAVVASEARKQNNSLLHTNTFFRQLSSAQTTFSSTKCRASVGGLLLQHRAPDEGARRAEGSRSQPRALRQTVGEAKKDASDGNLKRRRPGGRGREWIGERLVSGEECDAGWGKYEKMGEGLE